jgi:hypothetical protein
MGLQVNTLISGSTCECTGCTFHAFGTNNSADILLNGAYPNLILSGCTGDIKPVSSGAIAGQCTIKDMGEHWFKGTWDFTNIAPGNGASTTTFQIATMLGYGLITGTKIKTSTVFSGGTATTLTATIGVSGSANKYGDSYNLKAAVSDTNVGVTLRAGGQATSASINMTLTSDGNLDAFTQGQFDVWVRFARAN